MHWKVVLVLAFLVTLYLILGGIAFHYIEHPNETTNQEQALTANKEFLANFTCVDPEKFSELIQKIIEAYNQGIIASNDSMVSNSNWDIVSSIFFSTTVVTTIGYGHIAPVTHGGRAFCIIYALIGIPLVGAFLAGIGENIAESARARYKPAEENSKCSKYSRIWIGMIFLFSGAVVFIFIPSILFSYMERWTYGEALYYSAITLTTIGFGDFVAGLRSSGSQRIWYRLLISVWIPVGLAWCALLINEFSDVVKRYFSKPEVEPEDEEANEPNHVTGKTNNGFERDNHKMELNDIENK
ncbi:potassium channel subfamily K member 10-like [Tubulanus polymorphus]|uniref:potassium channel subfamily K member 10-like n=1 Tax=Tubulanus polymorphus TaxID=672921 RepID=UPI003DA3009B